MEDILTIALLAGYGSLIALDFAAPARVFPKVRFWRIKGLFFFVLFVVVATAAPMLWDGWIGEHRLIDATGLGTAGGALAGVLVVQLFTYSWHRLMHRVDFLWRWFHQMHHSAERIDIWGAFYFNPLDVLGFTIVGSSALVLVVGISAEAAIIVNFTLGLLSMFQHANLKTPRWLGYLIQRPENHALHHQRGVHAHNYGDIALWDMLLGTWKNPETWEGEAGYYDGASSRIAEMLIGRDVSDPRDEAPTQRAASLQQRIPGSTEGSLRA